MFEAFVVGLVPSPCPMPLPILLPLEEIIEDANGRVENAAAVQLRCWWNGWRERLAGAHAVAGSHESYIV